MTGLSKDVIRVWERRFDLLKPIRGANRYRQYSDEDVALLKYLKGQVDSGGSIGELARMGREELLTRIRANVPRTSIVEDTFRGLLRELLSALDPLDRVTFEKRLNGAVAVVPFEEALHGILLPLQTQVGQLWHDDHLDIAIEHYVTRQIQQKMFSALNQLPVAEFGPKLVVACPPGEEHDVASSAVAYRCRVRGCRVYHLGANVPIASLTHLCSRVDPDLTILSISLKLSEDKATALVRALADEGHSLAKLCVGGVGALASQDIFSHAHIEVLEDFAALDDKLEQLMRKTRS